MDDFLWHKVSEKQKEKIKKEANKIMNSFSEKLAEVDKKIFESVIEREKGEREEGRNSCEIDREIMFENALNKNNDFIIGEKKRW